MKALDPEIAEALKPRWLPDTLAYEMQRVPDGMHEFVILLTMRPTAYGLRGCRYAIVTKVGSEWAFCPWISGAVLDVLKELPPPTPDLLTPELRAEALKVSPPTLMQSFAPLVNTSAHLLRSLRDATHRVEQMRERAGQ